MTTFPLMTAILLMPLIGMLVLCFLPKEQEKAIKNIAAVAMMMALGMTIYAYVNYDFSIGGMQFTQSIPWITDLGVNYSVGVDGISLPLLFLTNLIGLAAVFSSWNVVDRVKEFFVLLLILIAGVAGTFIACDLFIFLLCYELVVIPIYIMVIMWGSTKRVTKEYAGMKLTIYLLLGSAFMLVGVVALYLQAFPAEYRTFDMNLLAQAHLYGSLSEPFQIFIFFLF